LLHLNWRRWPQGESRFAAEFQAGQHKKYISDCDLSAKTVKNLVGTLRIMWNSAKAWGYVGHDPFGGLVLPEWDPPEQPTFSPEDMRRIIAAAEPPYDTVYWLVAQTGIRRGEVCGLDVGHVDLTNRVIILSRQETRTRRSEVHPRAL
jgi:integrase